MAVLHVTRCACQARQCQARHRALVADVEHEHPHRAKLWRRVCHTVMPTDGKHSYEHQANGLLVWC